MRLDDIPFALQTDYIRLTAITYQSFGLYKNKALRDEVLYFLSLVSEKELYKNRGFFRSFYLILKTNYFSHIF